MNITSAIIRTNPQNIGAVRERLFELPGVEIHAETPDGRLIVTVEDRGEASVGETVTALQRLEGVLSVAMVYQYCDDVEQAHEVKP